MKYEKGTFIITPNKEVLRGKSTVLQTLFAWLCSYADERGQCFPARSTLSKDLSVDVRTIDKYLEELIELGLITKEKRKNRLKNLTNIYQIMVVEGVANDVRQGTTFARVANDVRQGSESNTLGVANVTTQRTNSNITNSNELNISISSPFEEFYNLYPSKKAKKVAMVSWERLNPSPELIGKIFEDVKQRSVSDRSWLEGFIPMPATYLNQERWNDEITPVRKNSRSLDVPYSTGKYKDDKKLIFKV